MFPIGARLRELREAKKLSQGHIQAMTGFLRCYTSRVENGHTVPRLEVLERYAKALEVPLYQLFYSKEYRAPLRPASTPKSLESLAREPGKAGEDARFLLKLKRRLSRLGEKERAVFLAFAKQVAGASE